MCRGSTNLSALNPPTSIINQDNTPQICLQTNLMETSTRLRILLPRYVQIHVRLTKNDQHNNNLTKRIQI